MGCGESSWPFFDPVVMSIISKARSGRNEREGIVAANIRFSNPNTLAKPPGYSYVVEATGPNRLIFIAGQLGLDMENKLVGAPGDFRAQANQAVENLKLALADAGATIKDVVKINNYLVDMTHIAIFREVRDHHFNMSAPPASTTVAISQLARPGALFEIEAIAVLPAKVAKAAKPAARRSNRKVKAARRKRK
jgi:enamine deaminase RidA (YjgF/YER057c/UK114 family)